VAHHGSRFSSSAAFLDASQPSFAVVSVGARNPFRHPTPEALERIRAAGARVYRTDVDGAVVLETDGTRLWVTQWARGITAVFELDPETRSGGPSDAPSETVPANLSARITPETRNPSQNTTASGRPEAVAGRAESRREVQAPSARS